MNAEALQQYKLLHIALLQLMMTTIPRQPPEGDILALGQLPVPPTQLVRDFWG